MTPSRTNRKPTGQASLFVTFEGIDGCGKSTQLKKCHRFLTGEGYDVVSLREPGSTKVSERIRKVLLDRRSEMGDITELLLYEAARAEVCRSEIAPALRRGAIVLCDRFYDSTTAYQGYGRGLDLAMVRRLHKIAVVDCHPDLTLVYDVDLKTANSRLGLKRDRLESQPAAFFRRVRKGFLEIAEHESRRVKLIDGRRPVEEVFAATLKHLRKRLA